MSSTGERHVLTHETGDDFHATSSARCVSGAFS
jgi:hypothetical protein